jgi:hypothetical protein
VSESDSYNWLDEPLPCSTLVQIAEAYAYQRCRQIRTAEDELAEATLVYILIHPAEITMVSGYDLGNSILEHTHCPLLKRFFRYRSEETSV